jgi:ABC-type phosphate/phosphonate transport system substrate-binding protein
MIKFFVLMCFLLSFSHTYAIKLGVLANRGLEEAKSKWSGVSHYLSQQLNQPVELVLLPIDQVLTAFSSKTVDILISNPVQSAAVFAKYQAIPLASVNQKKGGALFGGVIAVYNKSGIKSAKDLVGKKVLTFKINDSAGGNVFQVYHLLQKGVKPKDFAQYKEVGSQDDILMAVNAGIADAGFVRTGILESLREKKMLYRENLDILDHQKSSYPHVHSTALYPEWVVTAQPELSLSLISKVQDVLYKIPPDADALKQASIQGFIEPAALENLVRVLQTLNIPPFDREQGAACK